jgi:hypothetical protein
LILHLVNLTSAGTWRQPVHELIPVGPLKLRIQRPADVRGKRVRLLVGGKTDTAKALANWSRLQVQSVLDHEVVVLG